MSSPQVTMSEVDLSTRVPSFAGVYVGVTAPFVRGAIDDAFLVTDESEFLMIMAMRAEDK